MGVIHTPWNISADLFKAVTHNCMQRCDYGLRTSLAKEVEGQMSIVTQLPVPSPLFVYISHHAMYL